MQRLQLIIEIIYRFLSYDEFSEIRFSLADGPNSKSFIFRDKAYVVFFSVDKFHIFINHVKVKETTSIREAIHLILYGKEETDKLFAPIVDLQSLQKELKKIGHEYAALTQVIKKGYETVIAGDKVALPLYRLEQKAINLVLLYSLQNGCPERIGPYNLKDIIVNSYTGVELDFDAMMLSLSEGSVPLTNEHFAFLQALNILVDSFFKNPLYRRIDTAYRHLDFYKLKEFAAETNSGKILIAA